jgi:hypothetical protein
MTAWHEPNARSVSIDNPMRPVTRKKYTRDWIIVLDRRDKWDQAALNAFILGSEGMFCLVEGVERNRFDFSELYKKARFSFCGKFAWRRHLVYSVYC